MISSRLLRAQLQIQSHRFWLTSFVAKTRLTAATSPDSGERRSALRYGDARFLQQDSKVRRTNVRSSHAFKKLKRKQLGKEDEYSEFFHDLGQAVKNLDIPQVEQLYQSLKDKSVIRPNFFRNIAQCLHHSLRRQLRFDATNSRREQIEEHVAFAEMLVGDVKAGKLAPHCQAHVHLLGVFKESGWRDTGVRFWQWLEEQDDLHVNPDVYGAAIELLAVNGASLAEMERMYQVALERFPGNFSAYHLSTEAIVPDRNQRTTLAGIPMSLLQGILTARLLQGDTPNAYLALDTALRLYPDQVPPRFFQVFLEERSALEAYTVFAIACRGGIVLPSNQFRQLLGMLRTSSDLSTPIKHALAVRSMLSATYMYMGAGGQITANTLNEIIIAATQFLRIKGVFDLDSTEKQKLVAQVMDIIRSLFVISARYGVRPSLTAFNSIITNLGGFGNSRETIDIALVDMQSLGLKPNEVTRRSILTAAGVLGDGEYVVEAWEGLVEGRVQAGQNPDATDVHLLIKQAAYTREIEFAASEFKKFKVVIPETDHENIEAALEDANPRPRPEEGSGPLDISALAEEIQNTVNDILVIDRKTQHSPKIQDFSNQPLPMTLQPDISGLLLPEHEMRALYDEFAAEPGASQTESEIEDNVPESDPAFNVERNTYDATNGNEVAVESATGPSTDASPSHARSVTGIPFRILRYENWENINYLLEASKASDEAYLRIVDNAIAAGIVPPQRTLGLTLANNAKLRSYGLSDTLEVAQEMTQELAELDDAQIQERRDEILKLRGRLT